MAILKSSLGFKGDRGYSNYEIAVQNGYEGTEQEWIDHFGLDLSDYIQTSDVVDSLTSTSTSYPLSAKQGKELNTKIGDLSNLTTSVKTSTVAAVNELDSNKEEKTTVGDLSALATSDITSIVNSINCLASGEIVDSNLATTGYIKYSNGFLIQWQYKEITTSVTAWGSVYYYDTEMDSWAVPFITLFSSTVGCTNAQFWCGGSASKTHAGLVRVIRPNNSNYTIGLSVFAIGVWK